VQQALLERKVNKVKLGLLVHRVFKVFRVFKVQLERRVRKVKLVLLEHKVLQAQLELLD
jgi:hypothetical protein